MWFEALKSAKLNEEERTITICKRTFRLYQVLRQMVVSEGDSLTAVELIDFDHQLYSLCTNYNLGSLTLGKIDDIPFVYASQLLSPSLAKTRPEIYRSLMVRLCYQLSLGQIHCQHIQTDYFGLM